MLIALPTPEWCPLLTLMKGMAVAVHVTYAMASWARYLVSPSPLCFYASQDGTLGLVITQQNSG